MFVSHWLHLFRCQNDPFIDDVPIPLWHFWKMKKQIFWHPTGHKALITQLVMDIYHLTNDMEKHVKKKTWHGRKETIYFEYYKLIYKWFVKMTWKNWPNFQWRGAFRQDSRGWWSRFGPAGPNWRRRPPTRQWHPGRWHCSQVEVMRLAL